MDRWSYNQSMFLAVSLALCTQNFLFKIANYEVDPLKGATPKKYLEITSEGNATFVEDQRLLRSSRMPFGELGDLEE